VPGESSKRGGIFWGRAGRDGNIDVGEGGKEGHMCKHGKVSAHLPFRFVLLVEGPTYVG
jgi:hypothetical protein